VKRCALIFGKAGTVQFKPDMYRQSTFMTINTYVVKILLHIIKGCLNAIKLIVSWLKIVSGS
jgi:hypothetical protein